MQLWDTFLQLVTVLWQLLGQLLQLGLSHALLIGYVAWWLLGVNWKKMWPTLAQGAWAPVVLLLVMAAFAWSQIAPGACTCLGVVAVPNFWWQLGAVGLLAAVALFCGWLQGIFGWTPAEINLEPADHAPDHAHGDDIEHIHTHTHGPEHAHSGH
jgi:hypothetical protein